MIQVQTASTQEAEERRRQAEDVLLLETDCRLGVIRARFGVIRAREVRRLAHKSILRSSELDAVAACQIRSSAVVEDCCILLPHLVIAKPVSSTLLAEGPCRKDTADGGIGGTGVSQNRRAGRGGQSGSLAVWQWFPSVSVGVSCSRASATLVHWWQESGVVTPVLYNIAKRFPRLSRQVGEGTLQ